MKKDSLGDRMKNDYENRSKTYLTRKVPVIIRLDGKAFHTFTKDFKRPYDEILHYTMNNTMKYLCENIQGCKLGYTQSDEITLLLEDYETITTDAWFDYGVQKICSIASSMATLAFNSILSKKTEEYMDNLNEAWHNSEDEIKYAKVLINSANKAMFDCRAFNIPKDEVTNCFIWRQQDATRNAIQMLGQTHFSQKELHKKSCDEIQDMLMTEKHINFNDMSDEFKRGVCCLRKETTVNISGDSKNVVRNKWTIDKNIPIFTQDRNYIESLV